MNVHMVSPLVPVTSPMRSGTSAPGKQPNPAGSGPAEPVPADVRLFIPNPPSSRSRVAKAMEK